jgi:hypothetical protein
VNDGEEEEEEEEEDGGIFSEFRCNLDREYPDLYVRRGGWMKLVHQDDLHALKQAQMSVMKISLEKVWHHVIRSPARPDFSQLLSCGIPVVSPVF